MIRVPAVATLAVSQAIAAAAPQGIATRDSFRIGSAGVLCTAQNRSTDPNLSGMFDRSYAIVCRDAAAPVGRLYALRAGAADPLARLRERRAGEATCDDPRPAEIEGASDVTLAECRTVAGKLSYHVFSATRGRTIYVAEGLGGYDSVLRLGLRTLIANRAVTGEVQVATIATDDPAAFARVQAGVLDADQTLSEGYLRNNSGSYAEASEFFEALIERDAGGGARAGEYLANRALQQSNLGNFAEAANLFDRAERTPQARDRVVGRLIRNFRAIDLLNQREGSAALAMLDRAMPAMEAGGSTTLAAGTIDEALSRRLNRDTALGGMLGGADTRLTPVERARILDAQALQLRGMALRLERDHPGATRALEQAARAMMEVRGGRITTIAGLRSEGEAQLALIAEAQRDYPAAQAHFAQAVRIVATGYPESPALLTARAREAGYRARRGDTAAALALYKGVVTDSAKLPGSASGLRNLLQPYFALLAERAATDPAAVADMFAASQILVRPGVAQTQAVLARELSGGGDAAAALFRQSVTLTRDIARTTGEITRLATLAEPTPADTAMLVDARARIATYQQEQTETQARLGEYPRYRVLAPATLPLAELQALLRAGEAYYKVAIAGGDIYGLFVTRDGASAYRVNETLPALGRAVAGLRDSISAVEDGRQTTYPFDVAAARALYLALLGPVDARMAGVRHLIYEPDGPLLQLPANLLPTEQAGVDAYAARRGRPGADEYDFRGIAWLGRTRDVSTSVSPRAFADVRAIAASKAREAYLGLGQNAAPSPFARIAASTRGARGGDACDWGIESWNNPISAAELFQARRIVGGAGEVVTGAAFSDTALKARTDLARYRILHFATHGLVTAPRPECPARPALLTSFGGDDSDGLLTFREIYDLKLDADVVILSACDTAGAATAAATREAGITTGGDFALDGLVRAFVGAGGRAVLASHWPLPDDYDATRRLVSGMFQQPAGTPLATALRAAQMPLMDAAETSHPFYWSAFAVVGDGERPLIRKDR
ncbi:MAG: CHAT domain-containing protein [Sphingomonas sp.]